ncbi:MAG: phage holin family protein [Rubrivivax sp.]
MPQLLLSLLQELPKLVGDRVELLSLDLRRASSALGQITGLVVVLAILGVTAWLLIWGGVLVALVMVGLPPEAALLLGIAINLLGMWFAVSRIRALVPKLLLGTIRKHLTLTPMPPMPDDAAHPADAAADGSEKA